jgi:Zn-dependent peptidase ImmA (M78 family)
VTALKEYLLAQKMPPEKVASLGLSYERVEELYNDFEPTIEEIRKIAHGLRVAARDLILPVNRELGSRAKLRSNFNYKYDDWSFYEACRIENRFIELADAVGIHSNLPFFVDFERTPNSAEQLSRIFRVNFLQEDLSSSLIDLPYLLFKKFEVITFLFSSKKIDGASFRRNGSAIIAIAERNDIRMLYTLAHELGHLLVDISDYENSEAWIDEDVFSVHDASVRQIEFFANEFAASLLIPVEGLLEEVKSVNASLDGPDQLTAYHIGCIARRFGTSFSVAARRCENLSLIDTGGAVALENAVKKTYQSAEKYADLMNIPERPRVNWLNPAHLTLKRLLPEFETGALSWVRMHELFNLKIN